MKINWNKKYTTYAIYSALICAAIIFCIFIGVYMKYIWNAFLFVLNVFAPLIYGCIIAYLLTPLMRLFERGVFAKIKHGMIRRVISVTLTYIVFISALCLLVYAVGPQLGNSLSNLQKDLARYSNDLQNWLDDISERSPILASAVAAIMQNFDFSIFSQPFEQLIQSTYELIIKFYPYILGFLSSFMIQLKNIFIGLIFSGYILLYKELVFAQIKKFINAFLKTKTINTIKSVIKTADKTFGQYFTGAFLDAIFVGVITAIAMLIFQIPYIPLISVLIACTNVIPIFGPFIGGIPSFIIIFISNPLKALWFVGIILVIQQIDGNIIAPRIYSGTTGIPAIAVTVSLIVMGGLFGVIGMIIAVPVFALIGKFLHNVTEKRIAAKAAAENDISHSSNELQTLDDNSEIIDKSVLNTTESINEKNPETIIQNPDSEFNLQKINDNNIIQDTVSNTTVNNVDKIEDNSDNTTSVILTENIENKPSKTKRTNTKNKLSKHDKDNPKH